MMTRNGQQMMIGDTIDVLSAIDQLMRNGQLQDAHAYVLTAHDALTKMAHQWVQADAAYSVLAKSLKLLPEELARERSDDDTEPS